jgi:pyruvate/2-oxoglutarate dehydrogenase complex dihydrolipoamide dehydrogenase (E3) component
VQNVGYVGCSIKSAPQQGFHPVEGIYESEMFEGEIFKIVADKRTKMVVGAQILSNQAAELIPMILLLIKKGITVANLANSTSFEMTRFQEVSCAARACSQAIKSQ